jgi:hypothetical protein
MLPSSSGWHINAHEHNMKLPTSLYRHHKRLYKHPPKIFQRHCLRQHSRCVLRFGQPRGTRTSFRHVRASSKGYFPTMCPQHVAYWCSRAMSLFRKLWIKRRLLLYGGWLRLGGAVYVSPHFAVCISDAWNSVSKGNAEKKRRSLVKIQKKKSWTMTENVKAVWRTWSSEKRPYTGNWERSLTSQN